MRYAIKALREKAGLTQEQLARLLGMESESAVSMWETGNRQPRTNKLPVLAKIFNCSIDDLFNDHQEKPPNEDGVIDESEWGEIETVKEILTKVKTSIEEVAVAIEKQENLKNNSERRNGK